MGNLAERDVDQKERRQNEIGQQVPLPAGDIVWYGKRGEKEPYCQQDQ